MLEIGDIITLDANGRDYLVLKDVNYNGTTYYYLMTTDKPVEVAIVKLEQKDGETVIVTITDEEEIDAIMKLTAE